MGAHIFARITASLAAVMPTSPTRRFLDARAAASSSNKTVCEVPDATILQNPQTATLPGTNFDFYTISLIVTAACTAFTLVSMLVLMARHATHLSRPNEQLNTLRICSYLPILAVGSLIQVAAPASYVYLSPWLDFAQSVALCNFFLLLCQFVSPSDSHREVFFSGLKAPTSLRDRARRRPQNDDTASGLRWYRRMWLLIFQYPLVSFLVSVLTDITEAKEVYCLTSSSAHFAHLWLNIVHSISLTMAVLSCLRLSTALKQQLANHKPLAKLFAFKLLVGLTFLVEIVYWILRSVNPSPFHPTDQLSWFDLYAGIPTMIVAIATVPFSLFFHYAYPVTPYYLENVNRNLPLAHRQDHEAYPLRQSDEGSGPGKVRNHENVPVITSTAGSSYQGGFLGYRAWLGMLNPSELISGFVFGFTMLNKQNREAGVATIRRAQTGEFDR